MTRLDFHVDYNIEIPNLEEELALEAEQRLWLLAEEHTDLIGASVAVEKLAQDDVPFCARVSGGWFRAGRRAAGPQNLPGGWSASDPTTALRCAQQHHHRRCDLAQQRLWPCRRGFRRRDPAGSLCRPDCVGCVGMLAHAGSGADGSIGVSLYKGDQMALLRTFRCEEIIR
jgi:hypothetical protein